MVVSVVVLASISTNITVSATSRKLHCTAIFCIAFGVVMSVDEERIHQDMLKSRDAQSYRRADRYLAGFSRIRQIQDGLIERAKIARWPIVDPTRVDDDVERIFTLFNRVIDEYHS